MADFLLHASWEIVRNIMCLHLELNALIKKKKVLNMLFIYTVQLIRPYIAH